MGSSSSADVARGDVWLVAFDPVVGSEQAKTRPCVVVQRDAANRSGRTIIVVPLTDAAGRAESTIKPGVAAGSGGLEKQSLALCHQLRAVDGLRLLRKLGTLDTRTMAAVDGGLLAILDLRDG